MARSHGCNVASAPTTEGLIKLLKDFGVDGTQARRTLEQYHQAVALGESDVPLDAPSGRGSLSPSSLIGGEAPFFVMEVQPS